LANENSDVGHTKCSRGPHFPTTVLDSKVTSLSRATQELHVSCIHWNQYEFNTFATRSYSTKVIISAEPTVPLQQINQNKCKICKRPENHPRWERNKAAWLTAQYFQTFTLLPEQIIPFPV